MSSIITNAGGITGPSITPGIIGNPSPSQSGVLQAIESRFGNFSDTLWLATKRVLNTATGGVPQATAKAVEGIGKGAQLAGQGLAKAADSAGSGIRIGFILLVVVGGIILLAQLRRAVG
jgi:hypothetical protein